MAPHELTSISVAFLCAVASLGCTGVGPLPDASVCGCIDAPLLVGADGGFRVADVSWELSSCRTFTYTETSFSDGSSTSCGNEIPCSGDGVTIEDLRAALAHPDVVAAFAAAPVLYGNDLRPVDLPLILITQNERTVSLGADCDPACIPSGITALLGVLYALQEERLAEEDCASTFP